MPNAMSEILAQTAAFFAAEGWQYEEAAGPDGAPLLRLPFGGHNGQWTGVAQARDRQLLFYSVLPFPAPRERLGAALEFIARANFGMVLGNFEIDLDDGEIRYKTAADGGDAPFAPSLIKPVVYTNLLMTDRYLPGFQAVLGGVSARDAVAQVEAEPAHTAFEV